MSFMEWVAVIGVVFAGAIVWGIVQGIDKARGAAKIKKRIGELDNFKPADVYVSETNLLGLAIDPQRREIVLADEDKLRRFNVPSIVSCEILQDDVQLAYVNRGSQLASVAVGGVLLGGVGAVIGGLSGSTRSVNNVKKLILRFVTDDFDKPNHDIVLLDWSFSSKGIKRDNLIYQQALEIAELWHSRVRAMMKAEYERARETA